MGTGTVLKEISYITKPLMKDFRWLMRFVIPLGIFLAHFFIQIGRDTPFYYVFSQDWYYRDIIFSSAIALAAGVVISFNNVAILHYRSVFPNNGGLVFFYLCCGILIPSSLVFFLTQLHLAFNFSQDIYKTTYPYTEFPVAVFVIIAINVIVWLLLKLKTQHSVNIQPVSSPEKSIIPEVIFTENGNKVVPVKLKNIALITKSEHLQRIFTFDGSSYYSRQSLIELFSLMDKSTFFQVNRQVIIHREACGSFEQHSSGKLTLWSTVPETDSISVSQKRAQDFRNWLQFSLTSS